MDKLALQLVKDNLITSSITDSIIEVKPELLKFLRNENSVLSGEALNLSNLEFTNIGKLFEANQKLKYDYFKFGLYKAISEDKFTELIKLIKCPFNYIDTLLDYITETQNLKALEFLLSTNYSNFSEKIILTILKFILNLDVNSSIKFTPENKEFFETFSQNISTYLISYLLNVKIDKNYFLSIMKNNKDLRISPKELITLSNATILIYKNNTNNFEIFAIYFTIFSDLLLMFSVQNKIKGDIYSPLKNEIEIIKSQIRDLVEGKIISKQTEELKITKHKMLRYARSISREDVVTEYIKI